MAGAILGSTKQEPIVVRKPSTFMMKKKILYIKGARQARMTTAFTPARKKLAIESGMSDFDRRAYGWLSSLPVPSPSGLLSSLPVSPPPHDWKEEKKGNALSPSLWTATTLLPYPYLPTDCSAPSSTPLKSHDVDDQAVA
jgi:hypothetical protein